jgi:hypothetical protein
VAQRAQLGACWHYRNLCSILTTIVPKMMREMTANQGAKCRKGHELRPRIDGNQTPIVTTSGSAGKAPQGRQLAGRAANWHRAGLRE